MSATIYDVAKEANTSYGTVSRALSGHSRISEKTRKKVLQVAKKLKYRPDYAARALRMGKTSIIGMILPDFTNPFYGEFLRVVEEECLARNYQILPMDYALDPKRQRLSLERMLESRCDGIVGFITRQQSIEGLLEEFWDKRIPCIMPHLPFDEAGARVDGVCIDIAAGAEQAIDHLISLGHREISLIISDGSIRSIDSPDNFKNTIYKNPLYQVTDVQEDGRVIGLLRSFKKNGMQIGEHTVISKRSNNHLQDGAEAVRSLFKSHPSTTAIITANDLLATGALGALSELGLRVPNDVSVVSTDNSWVSQRWPVPITSIDLKTSDVAKAAAGILFERLKSSEWEKPSRLSFRAELIVRASTGPVRC